MSLSVGVETYGGHVEYCLTRGSWVPTEKSRVLKISQFEFLESARIVAGERATDVGSNIALGRWTVPSARWGIESKRPYASYIKRKPEHDDGLVRLVVMTCTVDAEERLTVTMTPINISARMMDDASGSDGEPLPLFTSATTETIFEGGVDAQTLHEDAVESHILEADLHTAVDGPRRQSSAARASFEHLVLVLWHSLEQPGDATIPDSHPSHQHGHHSHHPRHDDDTAILREAVRSGMKILVDNTGAHQSEQFWMHLETSLRRRIAFDDDEDTHDEL